MDKSLIVIVAVGLAFMYFVINLVGNLEDSDPRLQNSQSVKVKEYEKYYKEDSNGEIMLDFSSVSVEKGKQVWIESTLSKKIIKHFPDFDIMSEMAKNQLTDSEFKTFFLKKLNSIEGEYMGGKKSSDQAKDAIMKLN